MDNNDGPGEDSTQTTNSSSAISNLSLLDNNATDEFSRRILEHAKNDHQRMREATAGKGVQAFSKGRPRAGLSLTMENLERKNVSLAQDGGAPTRLESSWEDDLGSTRKHPSVSESDHSSPMNVNVPQQWGRKGRQKNDFLRRLSATSPPNVPDPGKTQDPDAIWPRRTILTGDSPRSDIDWPASPSDNALYPEDHDSPLRKVLTYGEHGIVEKRKSSIERKLHHGQEEPANEKTISDQEGKRRSGTGNDLPEENEGRRAGQGLSSSSDRRGGRIPRLRQPSSQTIRNADGVAIGTTNAIFDGAENMDIKSETSRTSLVAIKSTKGESVETESRRVRGRHREPGSRDLLKQLAASSTPSSAGKDTQKQSKLPTRRSTLPSRGQRDEAELADGQSPPLISNARSKHQKTDVLDDEAQSQHGAISQEDFLRVPDPAPPKTPVVTGAWIDTPAPRPSEADQKLPAELPPAAAAIRPSTDLDLPPASRVPNNPPSAASALLQNPEHLGQSTIATLRDLVDQIDDATTALTLDDSTVDLIQHVTDPAHAAQRERAKENAMLSRMDERLRAARSGLRDASRGLKRVEKEVEEVSSALEDSEVREARGARRHTGADGRCAACEGVTLWSLLRKAWRDLMSWFYVWDGGRRWVPRLTWLGLLCTLILSWYISEVTLCDIYCHQLYGPYMIGYGVDINAPRMPYVTTTILLKRPLHRLWRPLWPLLVFAYRLAFGGAPGAWEEEIIPGGYGYGYADSGGAAFGRPVARGFGADDVL